VKYTIALERDIFSQHKE